jgi:hypothetical protein
MHAALQEQRRVGVPEVVEMDGCELERAWLPFRTNVCARRIGMERRCGGERRGPISDATVASNIFLNPLVRLPDDLLL